MGVSNEFFDAMREQLLGEHAELERVAKERDTLINVLKECVVALDCINCEGRQVPFNEFLKIKDDAIAHAKSTLSKYERRK